MHKFTCLMLVLQCAVYLMCDTYKTLILRIRCLSNAFRMQSFNSFCPMENATHRAHCKVHEGFIIREQKGLKAIDKEKVGVTRNWVTELPTCVSG